MRIALKKQVLALVSLLAASIPSARGDVTYTFNLGTSTEEDQVRASVAEAASIINQYGSFNKHWDVYYHSGVPTAEANYSGYMKFGGSRNTRVVFHEGAHTFGMGTTTAYANLIAGGVWGGQYGNQAQFDTYNSYADGLHGDDHAIWPGGFNYDNEDGFIQRIWMLRVMAGIRCDMGILAYNKEAENELVHPGETAEFRVESPVATSYQWYKGTVALSNGGDISGATSPTLRIANAEVADEGSYHCAATGAGETLNSRARQLWVVASPQLVQLDLDGNVSDQVNTNSGTAFGSPAYTTGKVGQAIDLDGTNDYVTLPAEVGLAKDITVSAWVNWDGGNNWQRIFDFGTGEDQYMFLTPKSGSGTLRLAFKDRVYGLGAEQIVDTTVLPTAQWVHLAAVLNEEYATLYVNGLAVGSTFGIRTHLCNFLPTQNYIGKSQYADPLFNGRIDDFRIYNYALDGSEIWDLWGQSANTAPVFTTNVVVLPSVVSGEAYAAPALTNQVYDADGDTLIFTKLDGPVWLTVAANGTLSGTPNSADEGANVFHVRVKDPSGASSDAAIQIFVEPAPIDYEGGPIASWNFNDSALGAEDGVAMPDSDAYSVWRVAAVDQSGNGNHLTTWDHAWAGFNWSTNSQQGDFSMKSADEFPAAYTWSSESLPAGIDVESFDGSVFTVEALATVSGSGFRTVLGRDARSLATSNGSLAALYLGLDDGNHAVFKYTDVNGNSIALASTTTYAASDRVFHHFAGVSDGSTVSLYVDGALKAQSTGQSLAGLGIGTISGSGYHAGGWSVGRGLYDGSHVDRWYGYIDAIAISGVALEPGSFVITGTWPSRYDFYLADHGIAGAAFDDDADTNGVSNGMEFYLGSDPTNPDVPASVLSFSEDYLSVSHPYNPLASGVAGIVEWTSDLTSSNWFSTGLSYATNSSPSERVITLPGEVTDDMFIRLRVGQ